MKMLYVNDFFTNSSPYFRRLDGKIPIIIKFSPLTIIIFRWKEVILSQNIPNKLKLFLKYRLICA